MPKTAELTNFQQPLSLYPVVETLNESNGVIPFTIEALPAVELDKRITLARLAGLYGLQLGVKDGVTESEDILLEVAEQDFKNASVISLSSGLWIPPYDPRWRDPATEQLVRIRKNGDRESPAVVFPSDQFRIVARSPHDLAKHAMAQTRDANKDNPDRLEVEGKVGRSGGHALIGKMVGLDKLETSLASSRERVLIPLAREAGSNLRRHWQAHYLPKNIDKKRREYEEDLHATVDTAALNLNIGTTALKAAHRAVVSNLTRRGSNSELSLQWQNYVEFSRKYVQARRQKIAISLAECQVQMEFYQQFIDQKEASQSRLTI